MSKKHRSKRNPLPSRELMPSGSSEHSKDPHTVKKINWKLWLSAFASILFFFSVYQIAIYFMFEYIIHIYALSGAALALTFGILNRGFSRFDPQSITAPEGCAEKDRRAAIEKEIKRRALAKKFLIPLSGILFSLAFDMIYLIYIQPIIG